MEPVHYIHHALMEAIHGVDEAVRKAVVAVVDGFMASLCAGDDSEALGRCTAELAERLQGKDGSELPGLREFFTSLDGAASLTALDVHPLHGTAHLTADATRKGGRISFRCDLVRKGLAWKLSDCSHDLLTQAEFISVAAATRGIVPDSAKPAPPAAPSRKNSRGVLPIDSECPANHPIKISRTGIYHLPGGRFYADVVAVRCFATEAHAKAAGYRASQRG